MWIKKFLMGRLVKIQTKWVGHVEKMDKNRPRGGNMCTRRGEGGGGEEGCD